MSAWPSLQLDNPLSARSSSEVLALIRKNLKQNSLNKLAEIQDLSPKREVNDNTKALDVQEERREQERKSLAKAVRPSVSPIIPQPTEQKGGNELKVFTEGVRSSISSLRHSADEERSKDLKQLTAGLRQSFSTRQPTDKKNKLLPLKLSTRKEKKSATLPPSPILPEKMVDSQRAPLKFFPEREAGELGSPASEISPRKLKKVMFAADVKVEDGDNKSRPKKIKKARRKSLSHVAEDEQEDNYSPTNKDIDIDDSPKSRKILSPSTHPISPSLESKSLSEGRKPSPARYSIESSLIGKCSGIQEAENEEKSQLKPTIPPINIKPKFEVCNLNLSDRQIGIRSSLKERFPSTQRSSVTNAAEGLEYCPINPKYSLGKNLGGVFNLRNIQLSNTNSARRNYSISPAANWRKDDDLVSTIEAKLRLIHQYDSPNALIAGFNAGQNKRESWENIKLQALLSLKR